ncbi:hypothetical protein C9J12_29460 [Photobacterium frigidiphilum]|uniref:Uncharacterized protein n=1 Tax=Photobacterium frigidiphilum TaxID=264736 RepID=A0A2T3J5W0_9GAMM|nr:hypothetical protein [Photobacterium frigidiphilum]PSU41767.1 hypothetical protein C9J12_29460 [Photobacterium frigidiphilum]
MIKQNSPLTQQDKHPIKHGLKQGLTIEETRYIATIVDDATHEPDANLNALLHSQGTDDESLTPQGLHDFNTLINNTEKECTSWVKPPKDNP